MFQSIYPPSFTKSAKGRIRIEHIRVVVTNPTPVVRTIKLGLIVIWIIHAKMLNQDIFGLRNVALGWGTLECGLIWSWWRHQMVKFSVLLALCAGNAPVTGEFPSQRQVTRSIDVSFDLRLNKRLANNREAGDSRSHCAHYDATKMCWMTQIDMENGHALRPNM